MIVIPPLSRSERQRFGELLGTGTVSDFAAEQLAELVATPWSLESSDVAVLLWHRFAHDTADRARFMAFADTVSTLRLGWGP